MTDNKPNASTPLQDVPIGEVDVQGQDGVIWKTVIKLLRFNIVSVAVERISDGGGGKVPKGFELHRDPISGELREDHRYPWNGDTVSVWRSRLGDDRFRQAIKLWRQEASRLRKEPRP